MTIKLKVDVDSDGNALIPIGKSFGGQQVSVTLEIDSPTRPKPTGIHPPRMPLEGQAYRDFVKSLYGSYPEEIPEPPDPPLAPEKIF